MCGRHRRRLLSDAARLTRTAPRSGPVILWLVGQLHNVGERLCRGEFHCRRLILVKQQTSRPGTVQLRWRYALNPSNGGGTEVIESFEVEDILAMRLYWRALGWIRGSRMTQDMQRTLR